MPRTATRPPVSHERPSSFVSLLSGWVQQGVESFFATQRILVDLAMKQNTSAINTIRRELSRDEETAAANEGTTKNVLVELAVEGTANYIEAQRILLDLAQQENEIILRGVKERVGDRDTVVAMTNVLRGGIETFIEMQQNFLTLASKKTQGWLENTGSAGPAELADEAMKEFVAAQKKFLDLVAEETRKPDGKKVHKKAERTELVELGREATDSFITAQKKLLDLAGQQMNVTTQEAGRALEMRFPIRLTPMLNVVGDSVRGFVDAEKALVNSMGKAKSHAYAKDAHEPHAAKKTSRARKGKGRTRAHAAAAVETNA